MLMTWLVICALAAPATTEVAVDPLLSRPEIGKAPSVRPCCEGLPDPRKAPLDGRWLDAAVDEAATAANSQLAGTFLPKPLDVEVLRRLRLLDHYQGPEGICQRHLDAQARVHQSKLEGQSAVLEAQCVVQRVDQVVESTKQQGVPYWIAAVAIGAAGLAGYGLRAITAR